MQIHNVKQGSRHAPTPLAHTAVAFHRLLPGYAPTPLRDLPALASELGVGRFLVKDESARFGLEAFKILGGSWAVCRICSNAIGMDLSRCGSWDEVLREVVQLRPRRLVTATDGNHGRGIARMARLLGFDCTVYMPNHAVPVRVEAIRSEGANVELVEGGYDQAVAHATADADGDSIAWVVQDTGVGEGESPALWCAEGYITLFDEIDQQLDAIGAPAPDCFFIQIGVGTLAEAMIRGVRENQRWARTRLVGVEPESAACAIQSLQAEVMTTASGADYETIMAGLNCPSLSERAWPAIRDGLDACIAIEDSWAVKAMRALARHNVVSGESGASSTGALLALADSSENGLGLSGESTVLVINTEGATDPEGYERFIAAEATGTTF